MNLSEIRKKAQQERLAGQQAVAPPPRSPEPPATDLPVADLPAVVRAPVPTPDLVVTQVPNPTPPSVAPPPQPSPVAAEPGVAHFDPVAMILAGRQESLRENEVETSSVQPAADEEEFEECLCFRVAAERYAISIMEIKEITKPREMTEVPRVPDFVPGVISLRGVIVPIFDLKRRLHLAPVPDAGKSRIIVVKKGEDLYGILVDEVIQVVKVPAKTIEQPPAVLEGIDREFVRGIGRHDRRMLILLHLGKILDLSLT